MRLDQRYFSQRAYSKISELRDQIRDPGNYDRASNLIQGLGIYISTWGLHRLIGDAKKFGRPDNVEDTNYKAIVYTQFLDALQDLSQADFDITDPNSLIGSPDGKSGLQSREYIALNHLAMRLAREWSFWAPTILETPQTNTNNQN